MTNEQLIPFSTCSETVLSTLSSILHPQQLAKIAAIMNEVLPLLCPINVTSSSLCVFISSNPTVLYTIEFLKVIL